MLKDTRRLATTAISCLRVLAPYTAKAVQRTLLAADSKLIRLIHLLGNFGRYCELEEYVKMFNEVSPKVGVQSAKSTTDIIVDALLIFAQSNVVVSVRKIAIRNIGIIAVAHPRVFVYDEFLKILDNVMEGDDRDLKDTVIKVLSEFLSHEQEKADRAAKERGSENDNVDIGVLQGNTRKFVNDGYVFSCLIIGNKLNFECVCIDRTKILDVYFGCLCKVRR